MRKSYTVKSLALLLLLAALPNRSEALVMNFTVAKHPAERKYVILLGDAHNVGSVDENLAQMSLFLDEVKELNKTRSVDLLYEGVFSFSRIQNLNFEFQRIGKNSRTIKVNEGNAHYIDNYIGNDGEGKRLSEVSFSMASRIVDGNTFWMHFDLPEAIKQLKSDLRNFSIKSIDPRFLLVWPRFGALPREYNSDSYVSHLRNLEYYVDFELKVLNAHPDVRSYAKQLLKFCEREKKDFFAKLESISINENSVFLPAGLAGHAFPGSVLEIISTINILSSEKDVVVVVAGAAHTKKIAVWLGKRGYKFPLNIKTLMCGGNKGHISKKYREKCGWDTRNGYFTLDPKLERKLNGSLKKVFEVVK